MEEQNSYISESKLEDSYKYTNENINKDKFDNPISSKLIISNDNKSIEDKAVEAQKSSIVLQSNQNPEMLRSEGAAKNIKKANDGTLQMEKINQDYRAFNKLLAQNPLYSEKDKNIRRREFYRTYLPEISKYGRKFENDITNKIEELNAEINSDRTATSVIKKNVFALDEQEETESNWDADETLDKNQVAKIREIDRYMLSKATDDYKDKLLMQQIMGCTLRQRLAIYICIEQGVDKMSDAKLLFSQTNYSPDLADIKKAMNGSSVLRRIGLKRKHWSKMRRAYEYVINNRDFMDKLVEVVDHEAKEKQIKRYDNNIKEGDNGLLNLGDEEPVIQEASIKNIAQIAEVGKKLITLINTIKSKKPGDAVETEEIQRNLGELRSLVGLQIQVAGKNSKAWENYKKMVDFASTWYSGHTLSAESVTETMIRTHSQSFANTTASDDLDIFNGVNMYINPLMDVSKMLISIVDSGLNMSKQSNLTRARSVAGVVGSVDAAVNSVGTLIDMGTSIGWSPTAFTEWRLGGIKALNKNLAERGVNDYIGRLPFYNTTQIIGSVATIGTATIDVINAGIMKKRSKNIRDAIGNLGHKKSTEEGFDDYKKKNYKKTLANLVDRIASRKIASSITSTVTNVAGYLKYIIGWSPLGSVVTLGSTAIKYLSMGVEKLLKRRSDYSTVDEFLDLKGQMGELGLATMPSKEKKRFRKRIMLSLGFANTKTFFAHIAGKLGMMISEAIRNSRNINNVEGNAEDRAAANTYISIVKSMGLRVDISKGMPTAAQITAKLSQ